MPKRNTPTVKKNVHGQNIERKKHGMEQTVEWKNVNWDKRLKIKKRRLGQNVEK
jgi:hypothetical protein